MNRERAAWLISIVLLCILTFQLPGSIAQRDDDYAWVRTLVQVHRLVANNWVESVDDVKLKEKAVEGMLSDLDPYTIYIPPEHQEDFDHLIDGKLNGVGITLDMQDGKVVVVTPLEGSPADRAGISAGDIITKVNHEPIAGWNIDDVVKHVTGAAGTPVTLTIHRDTRDIDFTMIREEILLPTVLGYDRNKDDSWNYWVSKNPKIAYVRITQFDEKTADDLTSVLAGDPPSPDSPGKPGLLADGMQGLILDLRFNPGGRLDQAIRVVNLFVQKGSIIVTTRGRNRPEQITYAKDGALPWFPMIVLINEHSASASEIVSGSLKDNHRAEIVGARSYGKGSVQEVIPLDDNSGELKLTVAYYYLPSGRLVHRKKDATDWGVEPQIIVPVDDAGQHDIREQMLMRDTIRRLPTTASATATTKPTTQPVDPQLQAAENTIIGWAYLGNGFPPTTEPASSMPSTQ
jgi:carboxyl-terminal processing protease